MKGKTILISRTDSIGDVVLTLPVAAMIKQQLPGSRVLFLGKKYTRAVVAACEHVDDFLDWDEVEKRGLMHQTEWLKAWQADAILHVFPRKDIAVAAMKTGIPLRAGSTGRLWHYYTCNRLIRLSRRRSVLHEAQLNLRLLKVLGIRKFPELQEFAELFGLSRIREADPRMKSLLLPDRFNLILHPLSKGSAREWGMDRFMELAAMLPPERFTIFVTGSREEGLEIRSSGIFSLRHVYDLTGRFMLDELISFIGLADGLVAASTGPLHLAAAMGKVAIGIYPPIKPMHPGRWAPLGKQASYLFTDKHCNDCRHSGFCHCMHDILPELVREKLEQHADRKSTPSSGL
ncbi:MAG TPA: glycosyltransferase family 9 protein [Bacteroidales bacterium]|nr:glycosyltransferase family 9 protein [Bacteroidales bacterium]HSA42175.1 glycosyltransferase family 9 protein [Bacteroidales bacterium]